MVNSAIYNTLFNKNNKNNKNKFIGGQNKISNMISLLNDKKSFLIQVFGNLIFQLLITFIIAFNIKTDLLENNFNFIALIIGTLIIIFILALVPMPPLLKFILFTLFSAAWGLLLTEIKKKSSDEVIKTALIGVLAIFIIMFLIGLFLLASGIKFDYKVGGILLALLFIVIIAMIVLTFMKKYTMYHKSMAIIILILFSLYIIYDTNTILQREYLGDFITASLDYYLDILNIFINLVIYQS